MVRVNANLVALIRPGTDDAITRAFHAVDPERIHARFSGKCPWCPAITELFSKQFTQAANNPATSALRERMKKTLARIMDQQEDDEDRQGNEGS